MTAGLLVRLSQTDAAVARVVMLPHAGGTPSAYASWVQYFPDEIELIGASLPQPGAEAKQGFALPNLARHIAQALAQLTPLPTAIYGHSMGAMLAYPLATEMCTRGHAPPVHITVSASRPPHVPLKRRKMHLLPDAEFLHEVQKLGGTPEQVMREGGLMAARLPVMRAHFRALETYAPFKSPSASDVLDVGMLAYGGTDDHLAEADIAAWKDLTRADFACAMLEGGHFFNRAHAPLISKSLRIAIFKALARGAALSSPRPALRSGGAHV